MKLISLGAFSEAGLWQLGSVLAATNSVMEQARARGIGSGFAAEAALNGIRADLQRRWQGHSEPCAIELPELTRSGRAQAREAFQGLMAIFRSQSQGADAEPELVAAMQDAINLAERVAFAYRDAGENQGAVN